MTLRAVVATAIVAVVLAGCVGPSPSTSAASPPSADAAFPKPFVEAGPWQETEFVFEPAGDRAPTLDAALIAVRTYFLAGIRTQGPDHGVTIVQTGADPRTGTVSLLVTSIGGANNAVAGLQMRVLLHRDATGWWIDPKGESRVYCLEPLSGFAGTSCLD